MASVILSVILFLLGLLSPSARPVAKQSAPSRNEQAARARVLKAYAALPLSFEPNQGQAAKSDRFVARAPRYTLALRPDEAVLAVQESGVRSQGSAARHPRESGDPEKRVDSRLRGNDRAIPLGAGHLAAAKDKGQGTRDAIVRMKLVGANPGAVAVNVEKLPGVSNYYIGNDPSRWLTGVPTYRKVGFDQVYRGVDVRYYGTQGRLEYDFVVAPGADPRVIQLAIDDLGEGKVKSQKSKVKIDSQGDLVIALGGGEFVLRKPVAYQSDKSVKSVDSTFVLLAENRVGFKVGAYDRTKRLIIDPILLYSTYVGGNQSDVGYTIAIDSASPPNTYIAGVTTSTNFPTAGSPVYQSSKTGTTAAFVSKLVYSTTSGTSLTLAFSTYLGGSGFDRANGIAVDVNENFYVVGSTTSADFPVFPPATSTTPAFQTSYGGVTTNAAGTSNAFVTKFSSAGTLTSGGYSTYLGGSSADYGFAIALDPQGDAYVTGSASSNNFPTLYPLQPALAGSANAFVTEVNPIGTELLYSTYLGGEKNDSGQGIAADATGSAYVTGFTFSTKFPTSSPVIQATNHSASTSNAFVTKFKPGGQALAFSTYLGGKGTDQALAIAIDSTTNIYITGSTSSSDFPVTSGAFQLTNVNGTTDGSDAFVSKISPDGSKLIYSTYLGGTGADQGNAIAVDSSGDAWVTGSTESADFPTAGPPIQVYSSSKQKCPNTLPCPYAFVTELNPQFASLLFSTYLGGSAADVGNGIAVDLSGNAYVTGSTASTNFPTVYPTYQGLLGNTAGLSNAFVASISTTGSGPVVGLTPQTVHFGNITEGTDTAGSPPVPDSQIVTLANVGNQNLSITSVTSTNPDFNTIGSNCVAAGTVAPGAACTIVVTFTPQTTNHETADITITDNSGSSPQTVAVDGTGVPPTTSITLSPASLDFGDVSVGSSSAVQTVTLTNTGTTVLTITSPNGISASPSSDYAETNNCPASIPENGFCTIAVTFTPSTTGTRSGTLSFAGDFAGSPQSVPLTGIGVSGFSLTVPQYQQLLTIGTDSTTFTIGSIGPSNLYNDTITLACSTGTCSFNPNPIYCCNNGTSTLTVTGLSASGTSNPFPFTVTGTETTTSPNQTATLNLTIVFSDFTVAATPSVVNVAAGSSATYTVTVTPSNGFNKAVLLSCPAGLPAAATCVFSPSAVSLNGTANATSTLTITTTARSSKVPPGAFRRIPPGAMPTLLVGLLSLLLLLVAARETGNWKLETGGLRRRAAAVMLAALLAVSLTTGCESYITNLISPAPGTGTPAGNYTITVYGTLSGATTVIRGATINLGVS